MTDYISREAAIAYIRERSEEMQKAFEELGGESGIYADAYNDLAEDFHRIPAADVEPVRHGRWEGYTHSYYCGSDKYGMDGFPQDITKKPEPAVIPFPCTGNLSIGQAFDIFKYRMGDETVPIWAKVLAIEKIASFETLNGITKDELQQALRWLFEHYQFDV